MADDSRFPEAPDRSASPPTSSDPDPPRARRGPPPNPLYHPLFLPVLLVGYTLWFGYDGFLTGPEYEHRFFNQVMFAVTAAISLWVVPRGIREFQRDRERGQESQGEDKPPGADPE